MLESIFLWIFLYLQDDVRSLSLPGSYCEKITHLGRSLMGFTCLKHLDLSRNAIESLEAEGLPEESAASKHGNGMEVWEEMHCRKVLNPNSTSV